MKNIGRLLLTTIEAYFIGAITFYASSALIYGLTRFGNWTLFCPCGEM